MEQFQRKLNELFIEIYQSIQQLGEEALRQVGELNLTMNEMHLIGYAGKSMPVGITIRELAERLKIKSPSVTVAVQKLEAKGYVSKMSCMLDGRAIRVQLTRSGRRVVEAYQQCYHRMVTKAISKDTTEEEQVVLLRAARKLNAYFLESAGE